jgi:hypothetical protein
MYRFPTLILWSLLALSACTVDPEPAPLPPTSTAAPAQESEDYAGKGTIYDTQFKALHDAKQLGAQMNEDAARLDEQIDPDNHPPQQ